METFYDRVVKSCKAQGITPSRLCVNLGIRKAIMSDLKSGRVASIRADTIVAFAAALHVTTDYLLTGRETRLTAQESQLLNAWRHCTDDERQNVAFILRNYMDMPEETLAKQKEAI